MLRFLDALWGTVTVLAPPLFLGILIAGVLHTFVRRERITAHLGRPGFRSALKAALIGVPLPLCSCGVLPAAIALRKDGASRGAAASFLASTPQTGVDSIVATGGVLGWTVALAKVVAAFVAGVVSGTLVDHLYRNMEPEEAAGPVSCAGSQHTGWPRRIWDYSFGTIFRDIYRWLLLGLVISAFIVTFLEPGTLSRYELLKGPLGLLAALAVGIPLYVCSLASIPVAAALVYAGFPVGGALVFLMAGPATNAATMGAVWKSMGSKVFWSYIMSVVVVSLAAGLVLNSLDLTIDSQVLHGQHGAAGDPVGTVLGILMLAGIASWGVRDIMAKISSGSGRGRRVVFSIEGMGCMSCVNKVRDALRNLEGVIGVEVSLDDGRAYVRVEDGFDADEAVRALAGTGYRGRVISADE